MEDGMNSRLAVMAFAIVLAAPLCNAAPASAQQALTPQQQRMKDCNQTSAQRKLTGEARQTFMSQCLSGETSSSGAATTSQQQKMKSCNAQASKQQLKGDARQNFMSSCLKG
jgi:hypothetical protein